MLKAHKTSWPFREPVDPVSLNIPHYFDVIKEPMDLQTVEKNLKSKVYSTPTQFHADIAKIIRNSYEFNKLNADFCKLTSDFEQYYKKISSDSSRPVSFEIATAATQGDAKKKKKPNNREPIRFSEPGLNQPATLAEKKELALQIKKLPREGLKEVIDIVYEGKPPPEEFNLENLPLAKIRELQKYMRQKGHTL